MIESGFTSGRKFNQDITNKIKKMNRKQFPGNLAQPTVALCFYRSPWFLKNTSKISVIGIKAIILWVLTCFTCIISLPAQVDEKPQTIFQRDSAYQREFFFSPEMRLHFYGNDLQSEVSPLIGGTFGWVFNRTLMIGLGGFGKIAKTRYRANYPQMDESGRVLQNRHPMGLGYGYGGVILGYILNANSPVHLKFPVLIGLGTSNEYEIEPDGDHGTTINSPGFFVVEPGVSLELNLVDELRLEVGVTYRYIDTSRFEQLDSGSLNGLGLKIALIFVKTR